LPETVEAIQHTGVTTRILFITAHPDDEWPGLLEYLSHGPAAEVGLLTITRGQGGQNALGPEQGDQLGILRTEELLAADKIYGAHQFFTRAPDFGYSKSADEALKIWGNLALEDMVRVIRTFRPQIVINGWGGVRSGHGQHQASGILTPRAVAQAADPRAFPEQLSEGLHPWRTPLLLQIARSDARGSIEIPTNEISSLLGKSYTEMGIEGRSLHRSQGTPAAAAFSFFRQNPRLAVASESEIKKDLQPADLAEPLRFLARRFPSLQPALESVVALADQQVEAARKSALALDWPAAAKSLAAAGGAITNALKDVSSQSGVESADAAWELGRVRDKINQALADVMALHFNVRADRHELVAGEGFSVFASHEAPRVGSVEIQTPGLELPAGWTITNQKAVADGAHLTVSIPSDAKPPHSPEDAVLPWPPPFVQAAFQASMDGYVFTVKEPAVAVQATSTEVLTYPLELVPAVSLTVEPRQIMLPEKDLPKPVELLARVRYHGTLPMDVAPGLDVPPDWRAEPVARVHFVGPSDQLARFVVTPPAHPAAGAYALKPYARLGAAVFRESVEPLPTLPTRNWTEPADATVHVLDLIVPKPLRVGYVAAGNDLVPDALRQLGIQVDLLDEVALAFDDLRRFDAIVIGIRAYELRPDVARANARLLDYVARGGTLVVQYEHADVWNNLHPAPFPASMANPAARITDQNSPVRFVDPSSPLLNYPNRITLDDFKGWVQERGLYFWSTFDPRYQPVLGLQDPGEPEALGGLVYARDGKGIYIYTGLAFFRQLPAGVPGAYRLFVNLLSQSKAPPGGH
jgi:LmbE family N-acetylglucosaminyl deacetylase